MRARPRRICRNRSSVRLADGSRIVLDASTEVTVRYTAAARSLALVRGQARFDDVHDPLRPFTVTVDGRKVVATGTAFDVNLIGSELQVTLLKGHVVILPAGASVKPFLPTDAPGVNPHMADVAVTGIPPNLDRIPPGVGQPLIKSTGINDVPILTLTLSSAKLSSTRCSRSTSTCSGPMRRAWNWLPSNVRWCRPAGCA